MKKVLGQVAKNTGNQPALKTGDQRIDVAVALHSELQGSVDHVLTGMRNYLTAVRKLGEASDQLTISLTSFYQNTPEHGRLTEFQKCHEKLDHRVPDNLIKTANDFIVRKLEEYEASLEDAKKEIKHFQELHTSQQHYAKKMEKLEDDQRKKTSDNKDLKPKQLEKITRNRKKYEDAQTNASKMSESLTNRLDYLYNSRVDSMNPLLVKIVQFQQEYFRQSHNIIAAYRVDVNPAPVNAASSAAQTSATQEKSTFDMFGNRTAPAQPVTGGDMMASFGAPTGAPASTAASTPDTFAFGGTQATVPKRPVSLPPQSGTPSSWVSFTSNPEPAPTTSWGANSGAPLQPQPMSMPSQPPPVSLMEQMSMSSASPMKPAQAPSMFVGGGGYNTGSVSAAPQSHVNTLQPTPQSYNPPTRSTNPQQSARPPPPPMSSTLPPQSRMSNFGNLSSSAMASLDTQQPHDPFGVASTSSRQQPTKRRESEELVDKWFG